MIYSGRMKRMKIRKMKSNLDERQELKLLKIEHNGCWIAFWGLLIVMAIQMIVGNDSIKNLAGEGAVLMSLAFYLLVACIRNGIWDRRLKPNFKTNVIVSSIAAVFRSNGDYHHPGFFHNDAVSFDIRILFLPV